MGGLSADPGEKRGPRKDIERCISRTQIIPAPVEQRFRLESAPEAVILETYDLAKFVPCALKKSMTALTRDGSSFCPRRRIDIGIRSPRHSAKISVTLPVVIASATSHCGAHMIPDPDSAASRTVSASSETRLHTGADGKLPSRNRQCSTSPVRALRNPIRLKAVRS